jgi:hypothetical protein
MRLCALPLVVTLAVIVITVALPGCESAISVTYDADCEGLGPQYCLLPWPSDRWLTEDPSTETGFRLAYEAAAMPLNKDGEVFDVAAYAFRDGYSPASQILTLFSADVDTEGTLGLALEGQWDLSLAAGSPTVLLDLETLERIPHFVEVDARAHEDDATQLQPDRQLLYIRPARRLAENRSYGVALRNIVLTDGSDAQASESFAALRDDTLTDSEQLEARRPGFDRLFAALADAGVPRADLTQAWHFHTASGDNIRGSLLAMRDDAMERVPTGGGDCTVTDVREDYSSDTFRRVDGTFRSPRYMDSVYTGSRAVRGPDGLPEFQGWADIPFTVLIPHSLAAEDAAPGRLLSFGHGLMGQGKDEGGGGFLRSLGNRYDMVTVATDWQGMSVPDIATVGIALSDVSTFPSTGERLMQGVINNLVMTRSFKGACRDLPELQVPAGPAIDDGPPYWLGISQGGIMGGTVMALSQDITRGALLVGGANYPLLIGRSVDFYTYEVVFAVWYPERLDREVLMAVMISMWDHAEPNAWLPHLVADPLPDTPVKQILYQVARDDSQVPNVASDIAVRSMGIPLLTPSPVTPWGMPTSDGPEDSAYVYFDLGREPAPDGNQAPTEGNGAHGDQRWLDAALEQMNGFWQPDGQVVHTCVGPCDPE